MIKKNMNQKHVQIDVEQPEQVRYFKDLEIHSIRQLIAKAVIQSRLYQRTLDCAIHNRTRAATRLENAEAMQSENTVGSDKAIHFAKIQYELRIKELDIATDKVASVSSYINELQDRIERINGKQDYHEIHEEVISDLHRIFNEKNNRKPSFLF